MQCGGHLTPKKRRPLGKEPANKETRAMVADGNAQLELGDIQSGAVRPRPTPYVSSYIIIRIDDRRAGQDLLRRLIPYIRTAANPTRSDSDISLSVALSYHGLNALGVPQDSLDSFLPEFREGMAARAETLGDVGENSPAHWQKPLGTSDAHVLVHVLTPDETAHEALVERARAVYQSLSGLEIVFREDAHISPTGREAFGYVDGISQPGIEGTGIPGSNARESPLKAGEFVLGYLDETGQMPPMPRPDVLGRNGTYAVFRKLHQRVAAWRQYLRASAPNAEAEELLAAKMMGRWRSGAPLALAPEKDDPVLAADRTRNNDFLYHDDDPSGLRCPVGSHLRRMHPRDAFKDELVGVNRLHRLLRRGTSYGPPLPEDVLEDDGADRGIIGIFVGAHLKRQFEFVQSQWVNDGVFIGAPADKDPVIGRNAGTGSLTIPQRPVRRRLVGLPSFVVTRGGEYFFMPGMRAMRWLTDLDS